MSHSLITVTVQEMYGYPLLNEAELDAALSQSLNPRSPELLLEKMAALDLPQAPHILDAGCRDGRYSVRLAEQLNAHVHGADLVMANLGRRKKPAPAAVSYSQADLQQLPLKTAVFDAIFCRDVLGHIPDLTATFREFARLLKPNGHLLIYSTFATPLLHPDEAAQVLPALATANEGMSAQLVEETAVLAGFTLREKDIVGSEWREYWEENGERRTSQQLLLISRMRRNREALIAQIGETDYAIELANALWGVYQMLGKLEPTIYLFQK